MSEQIEAGLLAAHQRHMERLNTVDNSDLSPLEQLLIRDGVLLRLFMQSLAEYVHNMITGREADYAEVQRLRDEEQRLLIEEIFPKLGIDPNEED